MATVTNANMQPALIPKVSIVVPMFNVEPFLEHCLTSIQRQTFPDFECLCVDDGSPDRCAEIAHTYACGDSRFRLFRQNNCGLSSARNRGIHEARGTYLMFVDSDDLIHERALEWLLGAAATYGADYVCGNHACVAETYCTLPTPQGTDSHGFQVVYHSDSPLNDWLDERFDYGVSACMRLYRRELFQHIQFPLDMPIHEDTLVCPMVLAKSKTAVFLSNVVYFYRDRIGSLTRARNYLRSLEHLAANGRQARELGAHLRLPKTRLNVLLRNCGMACFGMVAVDLVLDRIMSPQERKSHIAKGRRLFIDLKREGIFRYSMVSLFVRLMLFVAFQMRIPLLARTVYALIWRKAWRKRSPFA